MRSPQQNQAAGPLVAVFKEQLSRFSMKVLKHFLGPQIRVDSEGYFDPD
jgi:hypothetical protein